MPPSDKASSAAPSREALALERARDLPNTRTATDVDALRRSFADHLKFTQGKDEHSATALDRYLAVAGAVRDRLTRRWIQTQQAYYRSDAKRVYYLSLEFLLGKALESNLINLGLLDNMKAAMGALGIELSDLYDQEPDAGLGNGGPQPVERDPGWNWWERYGRVEGLSTSGPWQGEAARQAWLGMSEAQRRKWKRTKWKAWKKKKG